MRTGVNDSVLSTYYLMVAQGVDAGVSILQVLGSLETMPGMKPELARVTTQVRQALRDGSTFADAVAPFPNVYTPLAMGLIEVGESIGALGDNLRKLSEIHAARHKMRTELVRRFTYPVMLVVLANYVPPIAVVLIKGFWGYVAHVTPRTFVLVFVMLLLVFGPTVGSALMGRRAVHAFLLQIPLFGPPYRLTCIARFTRALGTALAAGVEMGRSLDLARRATENAVLERRIEQALPTIKRHGLATGLTETKFFTASQMNIAATGEQTGNLGNNLNLIADQADEEARRLFESMARILGGALFVFAVMYSLFSMFAEFMGSVADFWEGIVGEAERSNPFEKLFKPR